MILEAGMEAPLGPESAEAVRLTLVKPPEGPCTTIWESTVSPRAPEREMEDVDPGASDWLTRFKLGVTQTGKFAADCCTPLPLSEMESGEPAALLTREIAPVALP